MKPHKLDVVLAIAWSATQWKDWPPRGQEPEIIEIGLCTIDGASLEVGEPVRLLAKPERSEVSRYCTKQTGITQSELADAPALADVLETVHYDYQGKKRVWVSWGVHDARELAKLCRAAHEPYPLSSAHVPLTSLVGLQRGLPTEQDAKTGLGVGPRAVDIAAAVASSFAGILAATRG